MLVYLLAVLAVGFAAGTWYAERKLTTRYTRLAARRESAAYMLGCAEALEMAGYTVRPLTPDGGEYKPLPLRREPFEKCIVSHAIILNGSVRVGVIHPDYIEEVIR